MTTLDLIRRLHEHRAWVNRNLREAARGLSDDSLRRSFPIGQGSIWHSLLHMYAAEYVWLATLEGNAQAVLPGDAPDKLPGNQQAAGGIGTFQQLENKWDQLDARWQAYLQRLSEAGLEELVARVSSDGVRRSTRRVDALVHVCTHAHYTAAQVVNMLRHVGAPELPNVMLIAMARQQMGNT